MVLFYCISLQKYQGIDYGPSIEHHVLDDAECGSSDEYLHIYAHCIDEQLQDCGPPNQIVHFDTSKPNEYITNARWESGGNIAKNDIAEKWCWMYEAPNIFPSRLNVIAALVVVNMYKWNTKNRLARDNWVHDPLIFLYVTIKEMTAIICVY